MSVFERARVAYLAGSWKSLKIVIEGKEYYVSVKDIYRTLDNFNFHAHILQLMKLTKEEAATVIKEWN